MQPWPWLDVGANLFSAVGTVGAFAVAMYLLRNQHRREEHHDEQTRRSQAVKVSAWIEDRPLRDGGRELAFHVHNASDMPIYEVSLPIPVPGNGQPSEAEFIGLVPPGQTVQRPAPKHWGRVLLLPGTGPARVPGHQRIPLDPRRTGLPHLR